MIISRKTLYDSNIVLVSFTHMKFFVILKFNSEDEAKDYIESYSNEYVKMLVKRMKIHLCKHDNMKSLDVGSKSHHFNYCLSCHIALHVDDSTEKDKLKMNIEFEFFILNKDIDSLTKESDRVTSKLTEKRKRLNYLVKIDEELKDHTK